ncbi:MAG: hypothetical protein ACR2LV_08565 [Solirubrobacteraceae bacterium]
MSARSFCWPKETVVRVLRDFVTLVESERKIVAEVVADDQGEEGYAALLSDLASRWQLFGRLANARFLLSAPVGEDVDDWLEAEMADVVFWKHCRRHPPASARDAGQLDELPSSTDPSLVCVSSATFLHLMRNFEMLVVSLDRVGSIEGELPPAQAAALFAEFCREWRVFELLAEDAAILSRALGGAILGALDDLPVWDANFQSHRSPRLPPRAAVNCVPSSSAWAVCGGSRPVDPQAKSLMARTRRC